MSLTVDSVRQTASLRIGSGRIHSDYATHNWGYHARAASVEVEQLVVNLLKSEAKVSGCSQAMMASRGYSGYIHGKVIPPKGSGQRNPTAGVVTTKFMYLLCIL